MRKSKGFFSIENILLKISEVFPVPTGYEVTFIKGLWPVIVGKSLNDISEPHSLRGQVLIILLKDERWVSVMNMHKKVLLKKLKGVLKDHPINKIHFIV